MQGRREGEREGDEDKAKKKSTDRGDDLLCAFDVRSFKQFVT